MQPAFTGERQHVDETVLKLAHEVIRFTSGFVASVKTYREVFRHGTSLLKHRFDVPPPAHRVEHGELYAATDAFAEAIAAAAHKSGIEGALAYELEFGVSRLIDVVPQQMALLVLGAPRGFEHWLSLATLQALQWAQYAYHDDNNGIGAAFACVAADHVGRRRERFLAALAATEQKPTA